MQFFINIFLSTLFTFRSICRNVAVGGFGIQGADVRATDTVGSSLAMDSKSLKRFIGGKRPYTLHRSFSGIIVYPQSVLEARNEIKDG